MKEKIAAAIGFILSINMTISGMVIHNDAKDKEGIRTEAGVYDEDYLFLGNELRFSGKAEDLLFLGKELTFSGETELGVLSIGGKLVFSGRTGNGVIAGGMNVVIDGKISGNSYVGCKSFRLSDEASITGNLFAGCVKCLIDGTLNGDLYVGAGELVINNEIHGDVTANAGRIIIGKKGKINGNLTYYSKEKLSDETSKKVTGAITFNEALSNHKGWIVSTKMKKLAHYLIYLGLCISFAIVGSLLLFFPAGKKLDAKLSERSFWNTALRGLIPILIYPAVILLCFVFVITIPLAVVLLLAIIPLFYIAAVIGTTLLGKYLAAKFKWNIEKRHYQFLIGALAGTIVLAIPFINIPAMLFLWALGWGAYYSFLFQKDWSV